MRHCGKARVDVIRKAEKDASIGKLNALYTTSRFSDYNDVMTLRKQCVHPRSDVVFEVASLLRFQNVAADVDVLQAPFEADF